MEGDFKWSQLTGTWVGRGDDAAQGVPARFTRPETDDERKERLERKEKEKKEAEERKAQEEKLAAEEKAKQEASGVTTDASAAPTAPMGQGTDAQPAPIAPNPVQIPNPVPATGAGAGPAAAAPPPPPPAGVPPVVPSPDESKPMAPASAVPQQAPLVGETQAPAAAVSATDDDTVMTPAPPLGVEVEKTEQAAQ